MIPQIDYTGWKFFADVVKEYKEDGYYLYDYGHHEIDVDKIIALSYDGVLNKEKLERLNDSIKQNGYIYKGFQDINLYKFPDGFYSVCHGGNHRPYLAKQLGIKRIMAQYSILIPKTLLSKKQIEICESLEIGDLTNEKLKKICIDVGLLPITNIRINIR